MIEVRNLVVRYGDKGRAAVDGVSFAIEPGQALGLVGESGCGKSSLVRAAIGLQPATAGEVLVDGAAFARLSSEARRRLRPDLQIVFQDPISSLNPRRRVRDLVAQPLRLWPDRVKGSHTEAVTRMLERVGLPVDRFGDRRAAQLSGGQAQRVAIARALILSPRLLVCDEAVSALDVSVQAQVLNLLGELRAEIGFSMLFVSHDIAVVRYVADEVLVMRGGRVLERLPADWLRQATDPYTRELLASVPELTPLEAS